MIEKPRLCVFIYNYALTNTVLRCYPVGIRSANMVRMRRESESETPSDQYRVLNPATHAQ
jgi:hypothetical protein